MNSTPALNIPALSDRALDILIRVVGEVLNDRETQPALDAYGHAALVEHEAALEAERARRDDALIEALEKGVEAGTFRVFDPSKGIEQFA